SHPERDGGKSVALHLYALAAPFPLKYAGWDFQNVSPEDDSDRAFDVILVAADDNRAGWQAAGIILMDVLRELFERHFHSPVGRVQPLQGLFGGSGRNIIRLASDEASAIGILYGVREENV